MFTEYCSGTRDRFPNEILPMRAKQSFTKDEANYGAERAIDGDYSTTNSAVSQNGENPWLKIYLGQLCSKSGEAQHEGRHLANLDLY